MTDYKATPEQWEHVHICAGMKHQVPWATADCILELRARVEALEAAAHKHILETNSDIVALFTRVESLEATERGASKVYEISKPLKLTPDQVEQLLDQLRPTFKRTPSPSQSSSSLVDRVSTAIALEDEKHYWPSTEGDARDVVESDMARAAIREVAAWMTSNPDVYFPPALVFALEQEANRG
jgi:hypothetical protein